MSSGATVLLTLFCNRLLSRSGKSKYVFLVVATLVSIRLSAQEFHVKQDSIPWSGNYKLKWSDFEGKADTSSEWGAGCAASIYVKGFWSNDLPNFSVSNSFIKNEAWTRDTTFTFMLEHEQLHFDIAELSARKIRKAVDSLRRNKIKTFEPYSAEIRRLLKLRTDTDRKYDEETDHGIKGNIQVIWRRKISKELDALSNYKGNSSTRKTSH